MDNIAFGHARGFSNVCRTTLGQPQEVGVSNGQSRLVEEAPINIPVLQTRIKPAVPPKKSSLTTAAAHVDLQGEVYRLTRQIAQMGEEIRNSRTRAEDAQNALDKMLIDLISTRGDLDVQLQAKASLETTLFDLQQNFNRLEVEHQYKNNQLSAVSTTSSSRERQLEEELEKVNHELKEQAKQINARELENSKIAAQLEQETRKIEQYVDEISQLKALHVATSLAHVEEIEGLKAATDKKIQEENMKEERYCQEIKELKSSHIAMSKAHVEELERLKSTLAAELDAKTATKCTEEIEQLKATHITELEQQRQVKSFFKANSERLSKEIVDLKEANRTLEETLNSSMSDQYRGLRDAIEALQSTLDSKDRDIEELKDRERGLLLTISKLESGKKEE
ncbi:hypothetical protein B7463_g10534, partial [Scytalidium lignicola]